MSRQAKSASERLSHQRGVRNDRRALRKELGKISGRFVDISALEEAENDDKLIAPKKG